MKSLRELLLRIDEINKTIAENEKNFSKTIKENRIKIKKLEEQKNREGLHGHSATVESIERQISQLRDVNSSNVMLKVEKKKCLIACNDIINNYYKNNNTIEDIFIKEDIPQDIQDQWFSKTDFGANTGYLYVEEINDYSEYHWKYYNPFTDERISSKNLAVLESMAELKGEKLIQFDSELVEKSQKRDLDIKERLQKSHDNYIVVPSSYMPKWEYEFRPSFRPQIDIDEELDDLQELSFGYATARRILSRLASDANVLSKEQVTRLCEIAIVNSQVYRCIYCKYSLRKILEKYEDIIDEVLFDRVVNKNGLVMD